MVGDVLSVLIQEEDLQRILMSTTCKNQVLKLQNVARGNNSNDPHFIKLLTQDYITLHTVC